MGNPYEGEEKAVEELQALSPEAKRFISHHVRNCLMQVTGGITSGNLEIANDAAWHILEDIKRIGC